MPFLEMAKKIVCNIIAVALAMSVAAVEALLPNRPDWLERVNDLALQLRTVSEDPRQAAENTSPSAPAARATDEEREQKASLDAERLLLAYNQLWQFVHGIRSEGLSLDDRFCERVEREWTVATLLSYMRNADKALQEKAGVTLETASTYLAAAVSDRGKPT